MAYEFVPGSYTHSVLSAILHVANAYAAYNRFREKSE